MEDFLIGRQKENSEFEIQFKNKGPEIIFEAIVNGEDVKFHASPKIMEYMMQNNMPDFFIGSDYCLYLKVEKIKGYANPKFYKKEK